ncbi:sigma-70 family RNA polymerase sigma factor [Peribacillus muralis]|uniref:sigma-70 family RNA polymerase sigma factor n=1 Tax=Peribacillus muralis TaxID=264697 RepID=UPI001F4F0E76|nr:sigma-70 family RNA polymerase sigma factor [Peribacillus muralis]MCK1992680.1 sigma-70 family RNA polymerase sigma factor [Peribacillus muralis]MCK2013235.1 sigma-70 family RNA polymerase sigma factor [Peribacillus muralis]
MTDFSTIAAKFTPMIHHIIRSLSIYKNEDEYFQIGLIALWESYQNFNADLGQFHNYAYTVIKGRLMNELKVHHKYETNTKLYDTVSLEIEDTFSIHEEAFNIENIVSYAEGLTLNQQRWLLQTYLQNKTVTEIAEKYLVSPSAVKSWRKSALAKLRKKMIVNSK